MSPLSNFEEVARQLPQVNQCLHQGRVNDALHLLTGLHDLAPFHPIVLTHLAGIALAREERESADNYIAYLFDPQCIVNDKSLVLHLADLLLKHSRFRSAYRILVKALSNIIVDEQLLLMLVRASLEARAVKAGLDCLDTYSDVVANSPSLLQHKANMLAMQGDFYNALIHIKQCLILQPSNSYALAAAAKFQKYQELDSEQVERFNSAVLSSQAGAEKARVLFGLAKIYNDCGEYTKAWQKATQANEQKRLEASFSLSNLQEQVKDVIAIMTNQTINRIGSNDRSEHIFVVGMPRSGTTLVEQILSKLPNFYAGGETPGLELAMNYSGVSANLMEAIKLGKAIDTDRMAEAYNCYFTEFENFSGSKIINKVPTNFFHVGLIKALFPNAKIINLQRNPLDVAVSIYFENFSPYFAYTNSLEDIFGVHTLYTEMMAHWSKCFPDDVLNLDYQTLVSDYAQTVAHLGDFLAIEMPDVASIRSAENHVETPSIWQVRQPINQKAIGRWRHYEAFLTDYSGRF